MRPDHVERARDPALHATQLERDEIAPVDAPVEHRPDDPAGIEKVFDSRVTGIRSDSGEVRYYEIRGEDSEEIESYVVIFSGAGVWGEITASIGFDAGLEAYRGLEIIGHSETPGLGGRIAEEWFKEQFRGKRPVLRAVSEEGSATGEEFNGITGATYSTTAIEDIMNSAIEYARGEIPAGGGEGE